MLVYNFSKVKIIFYGQKKASYRIIILIPINLIKMYSLFLKIIDFLMGSDGTTNQHYTKNIVDAGRMYGIHSAG